MKIQEGCDRWCTYCIIPSVRGPIRSRPVDEIRAEAESLAQAGFKEVVLTGIHLTSYGRDMKDGTTLLDAIRAAHDVQGIERVRLGSLEPVVVTEEFVAGIARMPKVCISSIWRCKAEAIRCLPACADAIRAASF